MRHIGRFLYYCARLAYSCTTMAHQEWESQNMRKKHKLRKEVWKKVKSSQALGFVILESLRYVKTNRTKPPFLLYFLLRVMSLCEFVCVPSMLRAVTWRDVMYRSVAATTIHRPISHCTALFESMIDRFYATAAPTWYLFLISQNGRR